MTRDQQQTILVTGGAGYIGSHSVLLLLDQDYRVIVVDNCSNAYTREIDNNGNIQELPESLKRVEELAGKSLTAFYKLDLAKDNLDTVFLRHSVRAVIHFASLKSVNESISTPLEYYTNNVTGTINLLNTMRRHGCRNLIFSSSATVYGLPQYLPVDEKHQVGLNILNPYGRTKFMIEQILMDLCSAPDNHKDTNQKWNIISLRYFNPVGAHPSGYIGEHSSEIPNNLMPYISQVAVGNREKLFIFGNDFDTIDGTGVRDYIHIMDLASGHTHALECLLDDKNSLKRDLYKVFNLGTGRGISVLELIKVFEETNGVKIPYEIIERRAGDAGEVYADAKLAFNEMGWSAKRTIADMVRDTYRWQRLNPDGFKSQPQKINHIHSCD